jgi:hypothetical protein
MQASMKGTRVALIVSAAALLSEAGADWGSVTIRMDGTNQQNFVQLDNSVLRVRYAYNDRGTLPQDGQHAIKELILKEKDNRNLCGDYLDVAAHRYYLKSASVVCDTGNTKSVHMTWEQKEAQSTVTIYRDLPVIKIEYTGTTPNIVDLNTNAGSHYYIYGSENWSRSIASTTYPKCYYHRNNDYCAGQNGEAVSDDDPGPLLYNGWFITGVYGDDGTGYGRIMPSKLNIIKLLNFGRIGFEYFHDSYTGFMFTVTGGSAQIETMGKMLADWANAGEQGLPGEETPVETARSTKAGRRSGPGTVLLNRLIAQSFRGFPEGATVSVFALDGRMACRAVAAPDRGAAIQRARVPAGAYVVRSEPEQVAAPRCCGRRGR